jgi:hypothetical protein
MQRLTTEHQQAVKRIIRYVAGTLDHDLYYPRCPGEAQLVGYSDLKRIIRYVAGTLDHDLYYPRCPGEAQLVGYSDNDNVGDINTSKSTSGIIFFLGKCLFS